VITHVWLSGLHFIRSLLSAQGPYSSVAETMIQSLPLLVSTVMAAFKQQHQLHVLCSCIVQPLVQAVQARPQVLGMTMSSMLLPLAEVLPPGANGRLLLLPLLQDLCRAPTSPPTQIIQTAGIADPSPMVNHYVTDESPSVNPTPPPQGGRTSIRGRQHSEVYCGIWRQRFNIAANLPSLATCITAAEPTMTPTADSEATSETAPCRAHCHFNNCDNRVLTPSSADSQPQELNMYKTCRSVSPAAYATSSLQTSRFLMAAKVVSSCLSTLLNDPAWAVREETSLRCAAVTAIIASIEAATCS
jgi:hypothetical protein